MAALLTFNRHVEAAVRKQDGEELRKLLRMRSEEASAAMHEYVNSGGSCPAPQAEPWGPLPVIVRHRHAASAALNASNWVEAYSHLTFAVVDYIAVLSKDTSWSLDFLYAICADLRIIAEQADRQLALEGYKANKLEDVERTLKKAFSVTNGDRSNAGPESKRVGTLEVINQLFRVYFKLNALRLCQHLIRTVNAPGFLDFEKSFPVAHRVTYKFYVGRLHLYEDRYAEAVDNLTYAVNRTPELYEINKRLILLYLIPARILRGTLPSRALLERYNMLWYVDITRALRTGNLRLFDEAVEKHEQFFIRKGLYLAIEKMRSLVYRSLCSKLYNARVAMSKVDPHKVKLDDVQLSLRVCGFEMSKDEVECILANLIYNGTIKGYLSHTVGYLVLSTKNPFPSLCRD
jgi:tetratricopeptide (TPR) repeat protein